MGFWQIEITSNKPSAKITLKSSTKFKISVVLLINFAAADNGILYFCLTLNFSILIQVIQDLRKVSFQSMGLNILSIRELFNFSVLIQVIQDLRKASFQSMGLNIISIRELFNFSVNWLVLTNNLCIFNAWFHVYPCLKNFWILHLSFYKKFD